MSRLVGYGVSQVPTNGMLGGMAYQDPINVTVNNISVGGGALTGTATQPLQVTGGAYVSGNLGIGSTNPTSKLQVVGDALVSGVITATTFFGNLTGYASTAGIATYATNAGIATYATNAGISTNVIGGIGSITQLQVTGISTFTNGPVLIGSGTSTGTATQPLQVTGGAYVSGSVGIGTTNPTQSLHIQGTARLTGALYDGNNTQGSSGQILSSTGSAVQWINASTTNVGSANSIAITADSTDASRYLTFVSTTSGNNVVYVDSDLLYNPSTNSLAINSTSFTGTASQNLQVTGGAYVSGNLGIGTINPSVKLQVGGTIGFNDSNIKIGDTNTGCSITSGSNNFFAGASAGRCNTTGSDNNFFGLNAGAGNTDGSGNNIFGPNAGRLIISGNNNNFFGRYSGYRNTTGFSNNFFGMSAGQYNTTGYHNNFLGSSSGVCNTTGSYNNFFGVNAGQCNTTGFNNNFLGNSAGRNNTTGIHNNFLGNSAGRNNTTGIHNNFFGNLAGLANTTGSHNNFLGLQAGASNTIGGCNIAIGYDAGYGNTSGSNNIFFGFRSGFNPTGQSGCFNFFAGRYTGCSNTTGSCNVFIGSYAGRNNTTGSNNNLFGHLAGADGATNNNNNFFGFEAGRANISGSNNNFLGNAAGRLNTTGTHNNFLGFRAGFANTTGCYNNFFGSQAGTYNTIGNNNNFLGNAAGRNNTTGSSNNFFGSLAGYGNTTGTHNNFFGFYAGRCNTVSHNNFLGYRAGNYNTTGAYNNFFGYLAGYTNTTGTHNNFLGQSAGIGNTSGSYNNFFGTSAGRCNTTGSLNNFFGANSGFFNTTGGGNNFFGSASGYCNTTGGGNNFFGTSAGRYNTTGGCNNFFGTSAGRYNTTGSNNNFLGVGAGYCNTTGCHNNFLGQSVGNSNTSGAFNNFFTINSGLKNTTGSSNNFIGADAGRYNTTGTNNNFLGRASGCCNTTGSNNNFLGNYSGVCNTTGGCNNFFGLNAGRCNTTGCHNFFVGHCAGFANTTGNYNNFFGRDSGICNTTGNYNNFIGNSAGRLNTTGTHNNFFGNNAGRLNTTGSDNFFGGYRAGFANINGNGNNFIGRYSGEANTTGSCNNFLGRQSGQSNTTGVENTFLGTLSGFCNITGNDNIFLGAFSGISTANSSKVIVGTGFNSSNLFDAPDTTKDRQLAIGSRNSTSASQYWIVGDENFNVGIGTTNPSQKLHVQGNARITGALYDGSNLAGSSGQILSSTGSAVQWINPNTTNVGSANSIAITLDSTNASRYLTFVSTTSGNNVVYVDSDLLYNPSTNSLGINTTSFTGTASQTLQVTGGAYVSGNLGIGITNPTSKLQVQGDVSIASTVGIGTVIDIVPYDTLNNGTLSWEGSAGQLFSITNNLTSGSIFSVNDVSGIPSIDVDANGTIQLAPYGGNIGVGTTNPTSKLHVIGNGLFTGDVTSGQLRVTGVSTFTNGPVLIGSGTSTGTVDQKLQVTGGAYVSGNFGVGRANPAGVSSAFTEIYYESGDPANATTALQVGMGAYLPFTSTRQYGIKVNQLGGRYAPQTGIRVDIPGTSGLFASATYYGIEAYTLASSQSNQRASSIVGFSSNTDKNYGNLNIGVEGTANSGTNSFGNTYGAILEGAVGGKFVAYGNAQSIGVYADAYLLSSPGAGQQAIPFLAASNGVELLRITSSGNLLVGSATSTGTTSQPLQVTGGAYVSGNLGLGITNPGAKLQVTPTSTGIAGLFSGTTSSDMVRITQLGTGNAIVVEDETNPDSSPFVITGIGSVGVGTANPQYKLHVVGDFGATTKSFVIPHPTKPGMTLRHGSLEGAENGVYVRGKTTESIIPLPDYWTGLVDEESITVNLTPKNGKLHSVVGISSNTVEIECIGGEVDCYFMILGERKDVAKLVAEY